MTKKKPILLTKHKLAGAQKSKRAKLIKPVAVPALNWGAAPKREEK